MSKAKTLESSSNPSEASTADSDKLEVERACFFPSSSFQRRSRMSPSQVIFFIEPTSSLVKVQTVVHKPHLVRIFRQLINTFSFLLGKTLPSSVSSSPEISLLQLSKTGPVWSRLLLYSLQALHTGLGLRARA